MRKWVHTTDMAIRHYEIRIRAISVGHRGRKKCFRNRSSFGAIANHRHLVGAKSAAWRHWFQ